MTRAAVCVVLVLTACGDDGMRITISDSQPLDAFVRCPRNRDSVCNPLTQAGCPAGDKCTWMLDALMPQYIGHIGCVPQGSADVDEPCMYGPPGCDGYDTCKQGLVCGDFRGGSGVCKKICDLNGGQPVCDDQHACAAYTGLFGMSETIPGAAGVCDRACDPLTENDFDGSGSASTKATTVCGTDTTIGCYGYPSWGTPPKTSWSCRADVNAAESQPLGLRHRVRCTTANHCADPTVYINSCNQGYLPLLYESTMLTTTICVALCKPKNCYAGNCGSGDDDRLGEAPHRCTSPDRLGAFDTSPGGEHCRFIWSFEIDDQNKFLRSPTSDVLGVCFDHSKYLYDSNADNVPDTPLPPCQLLQDGHGSGSDPTQPLTYFGAADLGCVDTLHAMLPLTKPTLPDLRPLFTRAVK